MKYSLKQNTKPSQSHLNQIRSNSISLIPHSLKVARGFKDFDLYDNLTSNTKPPQSPLEQGGRNSISLIPHSLKGARGFRLFLLFLFFSILPLSAQNTWTAKANFTNSRISVFSFSIALKGYFGGGQFSGISQQDFWEYDPTTNIWTQKANFGGGIRTTAVGFSIGTKGYAGTGHNGSSVFQDFWEYDPASNIWTQKANFGGSARAYATGFSINSKGYIGTGTTDFGATYLQDFWEYNPTTNTWVQKTNFSGGTRYWAFGLSIGSKGYLGLGGGGGVKQDWYEYEPINDTWTVKANFGGGARYITTGFTIGNKAYIGTGYSGGNIRQQDFWEFDQSLNTWTAKANFGGTARHSSIGLSVNNLGFLGTGDDGLPQQDFYQYTPGTTPSPNTTIISSISTTTATSGGTITIDGGYAITAKGVVWSTSSSPTVALATKTNDGSGTASFTSSLTGLSAGTQYYYRAYATNSQGTSYGTEYTFTTTQTGGTWARQTDFPMIRDWNTGFTIGTKGYLALGYDNVYYYKDLWEYDPSTCQWTQKADFGGTARRQATGFSIGTKAYVGTGYDGTNYLQDFWEYDQTGNTWVQKANFGGGIRAFAVGFAIGTKGYVGTGEDQASTKYQDFWEYDPTLNSWTAKTNFGGVIRTYATGFSLGTKGYIGCGFNAGTYYQDFWEYDPTLNSWTGKANFGGGGRAYAVGMSINTKGYVGIGFNVSNFQDWYEFDATANTWTAKTNFTGTGRFAAAGFSIGSIGYVGTGYDVAHKQDFYSYSPNSTPTITTTAITSLSTTSASSGGNVLGDGGTSVTARGLVWSASSNTPTTSIYDGITSNSTGTGAFTQTINALCPGTTYYVRAYATNSAGTSYGATESFTTTASAGDIWVQKANFGGGNRESGVSFSIGNKGYVGTGTDGVSNKQDFWEYDTYSNVWTQKANFGGVARYASTGFAIGTKGYIGTGYNGSEQSDFWEYDPSTNIWTQKANFGGGIRRATFSFSIGTKGYIGCGFNGSNQNDFWEYNQSTNIWTAKTNFPGVGRIGQLTFVLNSLGYVGGGSDGTNKQNELYEFNPSTNVWTQKANFGGGTYSSGTAFSIGNKGYLGIGSNATTHTNEMWEYDATLNTWIRKNDFTGPLRDSEHRFVVGNKAYLSGGSLSATVYNDLYEYTPTNIQPFITTAVSNITGSSGISGGTIDANYNGCANGALTDHGLVWNTTTAPTTSTNVGSYSAGAGSANFSATMTGLSGGTMYYVRTYSSNSEGTTYGNEVSFTTTTNSPPTLTTTAISSIGTTTASSGGNITSDGGASVTARGVVWDVATSPTTALSTKTSDGTGTGVFTSSITGLTPGTTYYVRAYATNSAGTNYGNEVSFSALPDVPTLTTTAISNIASTTADGGGNVTANNGAAVTDRGVVWDISTSPTTALATKTSDGTGNGAFTSSITGLSPGTTYYVRAFATNSAGTAYGSEVSFTTLAVPPTLTTTVISSIGTTTASSGGNITASGGAAVTDRGVVWDIATSPTTALATKTSDGTGIGIFTSSITGLTRATTYYVRSYATNSAGTSYGNELSFTTLPDLPSITTSAISNVTINSASGGGTVSSDGGAAVTAYGMVWGETSTPTISSNRGLSNDGSGTGAFTSSIISLDDGTLYYARAYATNSAGTSYGSAESFTTLALPVIADSSEPYTNVTNSTVKVSGRIVSFGDGGLIEQGFAWATHSGVTTSDTKALSSNITVGPVSFTIRNLPIASQIYFVQFVTTSLGTVYGEEFEIRTLNYTDTDGDGISDEVEQAGGNNGDSNRDGIPDYLQGGVTTVATNLPVGSNSANSLSASGMNYITVQALGCNSISDVFTNKSSDNGKYFYPVGIVEFKVPCGTARVKIYYHNYRSLQGYVYRKLNQYGNWITYSGAVFSTENFNGKQVATVILDLKDGSNGDSDGLTDGVITDPGGPALLIEPAIIPIWDWKYVVLLMSLFGFWIYKNKIV